MARKKRKTNQDVLRQQFYTVAVIIVTTLGLAHVHEQRAFETSQAIIVLGDSLEQQLAAQGCEKCIRNPNSSITCECAMRDGSQKDVQFEASAIEGCLKIKRRNGRLRCLKCKPGYRRRRGKCIPH